MHRYTLHTANQTIYTFKVSSSVLCVFLVHHEGEKMTAMLEVNLKMKMVSDVKSKAKTCFGSCSLRSNKRGKRKNEIKH